MPSPLERKPSDHQVSSGMHRNSPQADEEELEKGKGKPVGASARGGKAQASWGAESMCSGRGHRKDRRAP